MVFRIFRRKKYITRAEYPLHHKKIAPLPNGNLGNLIDYLLSRFEKRRIKQEIREREEREYREVETLVINGEKYPIEYIEEEKPLGTQNGNKTILEKVYHVGCKRLNHVLVGRNLEDAIDAMREYIFNQTIRSVS
jgi:hypothetical protein